MHDIMKYAWFIKSSPPTTHNTDVTVSDNGVLMCYLELNYRGYGHKSFKEGATSKSTLFDKKV